MLFYLFKFDYFIWSQLMALKATTRNVLSNENLKIHRRNLKIASLCLIVIESMRSSVITLSKFYICLLKQRGTLQLAINPAWLNSINPTEFA